MAVVLPKFEYLKKKYYDPKSRIYLARAQVIYDILKKNSKYLFTLQEIKYWLTSQDVYTNFSHKRKNKHFRRVYVPISGYQLDLDTGFYNTGKGKHHAFVLAIDIFDGRIYAAPVTNIKAPAMLTALKDIFDHLGNTYSKLRTDKGVEYGSSRVSEFLKSRDIKHFTAAPPMKANFAERAIASLKSLLTRLATVQKHKSWVELLPNALKILNNRVHSRKKLTPIQASKPENQYKVLRAVDRLHLNAQGEPITFFNYPLNQIVRIRLAATSFRKDHEKKNSNQLYQIIGRKIYDNIQYYTLRSYPENIEIDAPFTVGELQVSNSEQFVIEKIYLKKTKIINGVKNVLIKWLGINNKSYISMQDLKKYKQHDDAAI